jgi:hypothetical protein
MPDLQGGEYYGPDGMFERAGAPTKVGCTRAARDVRSAERLWDLSERETGVTFDWA